MSTLSAITAPLTQPSSPPPSASNAPPATETQGTSQTDDTSQSNTSTQTQSNTQPSTQVSENNQTTPKDDTSTIAAERQVAANTQVPEAIEDADIQPARIEEDDAQALAVARALAEEYRSLAIREQYISGITNLNAVDKNGEKLDLRVPLIDQLPDKPMPEITPNKT